VTGVALVALLVPLGLTSYRIALDSTLEASLREETRAWLQGSDYELVAVDADDAEVDIVIDGSGPVPSVEPLYASIEGVRSGLRVELRIIPVERVELRPAGPGAAASPSP
jgi:hypothetical protein